MNAAAAPTFLAAAEGLARRAAHEARVRPWTASRLERNGRGEKHRVYDFLFTYYGYKPGRLARWEPGFGVALTGEGAEEFLKIPGYVETTSGVTLDPAELTPKRLESVKWIRALLAATRDRAGNFGCFGLHEWAMVYRAAEVRHDLPLRLPPDALAEFVESLPVRCTHFDAFRFFTPEARPLNRILPTRESSPELEQPGCLHANMDLYKWAYKLAPFCPSELMADAFELAVVARETDMRASPYDVSSLGFVNIPIETPEGRARYESEQRAIAKNLAVRDALIALSCDRAARGGVNGTNLFRSQEQIG